MSLWPGVVARYLSLLVLCAALGLVLRHGCLPVPAEAQEPRSERRADPGRVSPSGPGRRAARVADPRATPATGDGEAGGRAGEHGGGDGAGRASIDDPSLVALARALDRRMTVWTRPDGRRIYVRYCREAVHGCPARIAAFTRLIGTVSREHGLDPFLLAAIAVHESGLAPFAAGGVGERGIVQLHPRGVGEDVRFVQSARYRRRCRQRDDACQREVLDAGAHLMARAIERCGGVAEALGAYNRGECGVTGYSRRVMAERQRLLRLAKRGDGGEA